MGSFRPHIATALALLLAADPVLAGLAAPSLPAAPAPLRLIQDIHTHPEAQRSIAALLGRLQEERGGSLRVGVEGAAGPFNFAPYYEFPDDQLRRAVASDLLDESRIAGPVFAALCRPKIHLLGIETPDLYRANVDAYLRARDSQSRLLNDVAGKKADLARRKAAAFGADLARFDGAVERHRSGAISFGEYLETVAQAAGETGLAVETFLAAHRMETSLDFARVEAERKRFVERLAAALEPGEADQVRRWIEGLTEEAGAGRRFDYLFHVARAKEIDLASFPALADYARYLRLAEGVDTGRLFTEAAEAEEAGYRRYAGDSLTVAGLIVEARRLYLTEKLLRFELAREDWRAYSRLRESGAALPEKDLAPFEDFYRVAAQRDGELARRALAGKLDAIVVGGFHTEGMMAALRKAGVPIEVVRPKITSVAPGEASSYLNTFAARRTPLDRLFSQFKLFLNPPAVIGVSVPLVPSGNDDAKEIWVKDYRGKAAGQPVLLKKIDAAAQRLHESAAAGPAPDWGWLMETSSLFVLAAGLATGSDWLVLVGVVAHVLGLPAAHIGKDRASANPFYRFSQRLVWSAVFLGAYAAGFILTIAVGMPVPVGAFLALAAPAWAHRLNHVAIQFPKSAVASVFFTVLRLPPLRMSTSEPRELNREQTLRYEAVKRDMDAAVRQWRQEPNKLALDVESDPITAVIALIEAELIGSGNEQNTFPVFLAVTNSLASASLSREEMNARLRRDAAAIGARLFDSDPRTTAYGIRMVIMNDVLEAIALRQGLDFNQIRFAGAVESMRRVTMAAIADWRSRRGNDLSAANERLARVFSWPASLSAEDTFVERFVEGISQGLQGSDLTADEVKARVRMDVRDAIRIAEPLAARPIALRVYAAFIEAAKNRKREDLVAAAQNAISLAVQEQATREFGILLSAWKASHDNPGERVGRPIYDFMLNVFERQKRTEKSLASCVTGVANAYLGAGLSDVEMAVRLMSDVTRAVGSRFIGAGHGVSYLTAMGRMLEEMTQAAPEQAEAIRLSTRHGAQIGVQFGIDIVVSHLRRVGGQALEIGELTATLTDIGDTTSLSDEELARVVAEKLLEASLTAPETFQVVSQLLHPLLDDPVDALSPRRFNLARRIATLIQERATGAAKEAAAAALSRALMTPSALTATFAEEESAALWKRLLGLKALAPEEAPSVSDMAAAIRAAGLTEEQLRDRAHRDMLDAVRSFLGRKLTDAEAIWNDKVTDPRLTLVLDVYLEVARSFHASGDPLAQVVVRSLADAFLEAYRTDVDKDTAHPHKLTVTLSFLGHAALAMGLAKEAELSAEIMLVALNLSLETPEIVRDALDIRSRASLMAGDSGRAIEQGYEYATAMMYQDLSTSIVAAKEWAPFLERAHTLGLILMDVGAYSAGRAYFKWALTFIEKHPTIRRSLKPGLEDRFRAGFAGATVITARDLAVIQEHLAVWDRHGLVVLADESLSPEERSAYLHMSMEVNVVACLTGDASRLSTVQSAGEAAYKNRPLALIPQMAEGLRYLARARPAEAPQYDKTATALFATTAPDPAVAGTIDEVLYVAAYASHEAGFGRYARAEEILRALLARVTSDGFSRTLKQDSSIVEDMGVVVARLKMIILMRQAGVMSARGASADDVSAVLKEIFTIKAYDPRVQADLQSQLDPTFTNEKVILEAVGKLVMVKERDYPIEGRIRAVQWVRALAPALAAEREKVWMQKAPSPVKRVLQEMLPLLSTLDSGDWPGRTFLRLSHPFKMAAHQRRHEEVLARFPDRKPTDIQAFHEALGESRRDRQRYATVLVGAGLAEESIETLRVGRRLVIEGLKTFVPNLSRMRYPEDVGLLKYSLVGGLVPEVIKIAESEIGNDDAVLKHYANTIVQAADRLGEHRGYKDARVFTEILDAAIRVMERYKKIGIVVEANFVLFGIYFLQGNVRQFFEMGYKIGAEALETEDHRVYRMRALMGMAARFSNPSLPLPKRIETSQQLVDLSRGEASHDQVFDRHVSLIISLLRFDPSDAAAGPALARQVLESLTYVLQKNVLKRLLPVGFFLRVAEAGLAAGPQASAEILDMLQGVEPLIGERAEVLDLAVQMLSTLGSDPATFLAWLDAHPPRAPSAEHAMLRMVAADRAGDGDRAWAEVRRVADERPAYFPEAGALLLAGDTLMDSPMARSTFLSLLKKELSAFKPERWKDAASKESLRRMLEVASYLGDPEVVYLCDALAETPSFPLRDLLTKPNVGLLARMEPGLTMDEWAERIGRISPNRVKVLQTAAEKYFPGDADRQRLTGLLVEKRAELERREAARQALTAAKEQARRLLDQARAEYEALRFEQAAQIVGGIAVEHRPSDAGPFIAQVERFVNAWGTYQGGDFDTALALLSAGQDDAPTALLRRQIGAVKRAREELASRRPQMAEITLGSLDGNFDDAQHARLSVEVAKARQSAEQAFVALKQRIGQVKVGSPAATFEAVRSALKAVLAIDSEFETMMTYVIGRAEDMTNRRLYDAAEELLFIFRQEAPIFTKSFPSFARFAGLRSDWERVRGLTRALGMKLVLGRELKVWRTVMQAEDHALARSAPTGDPSQTLDKQIFQLTGWTISSSGIIEVTGLAREKIEERKKKDDPVDLEKINLQATELFKENTTFQLIFGGGKTRVIASFLRRDSARGLIFQADPASVDLLAERSQSKEMPKMRYMEDVQVLAKVTALTRAIDILDRYVGLATAGTLPTVSDPVVSRYLGLDISEQGHQARPDGPTVQEHFHAVPAQHAAILAAIHPENQTTAVQGPPGTGKTTTAVEIAKILTSPSGGGEICVFAAQAHAALDNLAEKLQRAGVRVVRSAADGSQAKVAKLFQADERERLRQLMDAIENHYASGVGFAYLATNMGLRGDRKCFDLFNLYLSGEPMTEVRIRYLYLSRPSGSSVDVRSVRRDARSDAPRPPIKIVLAQEEAGQASLAEAMVPLMMFKAKKGLSFGDQDQLAPHPADDEDVASVREEIRHGMEPTEGKFEEIFSAQALEAMEISLFEMAYLYAIRAGGIILGFLNVARRSPWFVTYAIVNQFYDDQLRHRQADEPRESWSKPAQDAVIFVDSKGRERKTKLRDAHGESIVNYTQVGDAIRAVQYHLNGHSLKHPDQERKPGDILVLTPYRGQNEAINHTLRWLAIFNDFAQGQLVPDMQLKLASDLFQHHFAAAGASIQEQAEAASLLAGIGRGNKAENVSNLIKIMARFIDVQFDGQRALTRNDLPPLAKAKAPSAGKTRRQADDQESLDEQKANFIEAKTVASVQGWERPVVIFSSVRSDSLGFLDGKKGERIFNVGLSRVQEQLVVIYNGKMVPEYVNAEKPRSGRSSMLTRLGEAYEMKGLTFKVFDRFPSALVLIWFALLIVTALSPTPEALFAILPVMLVRVLRDPRADAALGLGEARPLGVDALGGVGEVRTANQVEALAPPAPRAFQAPGVPEWRRRLSGV